MPPTQPADARTMRAWSDVDAATLRGVQAVACDFDDTLTRHGVLDHAALAALHTLRDAGIPCVIATGRPLGWGAVLARVLPVRAVVTENGNAWIVREGPALVPDFVEPRSAVAERMKHAALAVDALLRETPTLARVTDYTERVTDFALDIGETAHVPRDLVDAAAARLATAGLHSVASTVHLHVSPYPPDKLSGLERVARALGLDPQRVRSHWVYVGDSPNDAVPFAAMALSVGVANVRDFLGRIDAEPRFVTTASHGAGFAEVVARLCTARAGAPEGTPR